MLDHPLRVFSVDCRALQDEGRSKVLDIRHLTDLLLQMVLPIKDIIAAQKSKAYRFGYSGLVLVVRGHEELFFEFWSKDARNRLRAIVDSKIEEYRQSLAHKKFDNPTGSLKEALDLKDLIPSIDPPAELVKENQQDVPPVMFQSTSSSFVTFRPDKSLRFTCLAIGQQIFSNYNSILIAVRRLTRGRTTVHCAL